MVLMSSQQQRIDAALDSQAKRVLQKAIEHKQMRKYFYNMLDATSEFLETESNRDVDTVGQYLEAARFAATQGRRYPVESLENWLNENTK